LGPVIQSLPRLRMFWVAPELRALGERR